MRHLLAGLPLFADYTLFGTREGRVDELMLGFSETFGPLTLAMKSKWKRYSQYFDDEGHRTKKMPHDRTQNEAESEEGKEQTNHESDVGSSDSEHSDKAALEAEMEDYFAESAAAGHPIVLEERPEPISLLLEDRIDCFTPTGMYREESGRVKALLRRIFQYEPEKRPRAADLQRDPWFADSEDELAERSRKRKRKRLSMDP